MSGVFHVLVLDKDFSKSVKQSTWMKAIVLIGHFNNEAFVTWDLFMILIVASSTGISAQCSEQNKEQVTAS